ncbi:electron transport protein SCO1/SenC [Oceanibaculum pacificum]|uniref:Electron transport protein SCO1/SenC n=2 Tax=Oceanibaculum pacificum TaxID=580166 RepID=A0A154WFU5_9PROT|nr:electron transport protein SCO1/SenC [Oceanibaculum pacificum]
MGFLGLYAWKTSFQDDARQSALAAIRPDYTLTAHTGETVTERNYLGKWQLVFFGFTHCPDICPTTLAEVATVMDGLGEAARNVQPLFISIDPERDRPAAMAEYVAAFHPALIGLTGEPEAVAEAAQSFYAYYEMQPQSDAPDGYTMSHSSALYLLDPNGRFVHLFSYGTPAAEIVEDLKEKL